MTRPFDPDRDLVVARIIKAPRRSVWRAWTEPAKLERWFLPAPSLCRVLSLDLRPGGALLTEMSESGGAFVPHIDACILVVDDAERFVFTDTLTGGWRPGKEPFMTAVITMKDHAEGTDYTAYAMHKDPETRALHEKLGFHDGWGTVTEQLARLVEQQA